MSYQTSGIEQSLQALQAANQSLRTQLAEKEAESAVMRGAFEKWKAYWQTSETGPITDSEQAGEDFTDAWFTMEQALSTSAGKSLLARLEEAVRLLSRAHPGMHTCETGQWFTDRDTVLEQLKGGV